MRWTAIGLGIALLAFLINHPCEPSRPPTALPPLQEEMVEVHWLSEGEPAPFDGLLINPYTYERIVLKLWECDKR